MIPSGSHNDVSRNVCAFTDAAIDAIVIANTNSLHGEYARRAAAAGKHVFVEKPLALSARDARQSETATFLAAR